MDISNTHCEFMIKRGHNCICGNIENMSFKNNLFDITICCGTLQLVLSYEQTLRELIRVTKKGGLILITIPWEQKLIKFIDYDNVNGTTGIAFRTFNDNNFKTRFLDYGLKLLKKQLIPATPAPDNPNSKYIQCMNLIFQCE